MAWARTVAVVVPSPAVSEVFEATSRTICAPAFSSSSLSSISFATVTPSLVIVGEPNFFSMTTLRPFGPSVTFTASASLLTPLRIAWRASSPYVTRLAIGVSPYRLSFRAPQSARNLGGGVSHPTRSFAVPSHALRACFAAQDDADASSLHNREDFVLAQNRVLDVIDLDLG